jgi:hypothetical protein
LEKKSGSKPNMTPEVELVLLDHAFWKLAGVKFGNADVGQ